MTIFAIVNEGGTIINTVLADEAMDGWIELQPGFGIGDIYVGGQFVKKYNVEGNSVSPIEFKLLFTPQERIAIKEAVKTDLIVQDFFEIVGDPRLTKVDLDNPTTLAALDYLTAIGILGPGRRAVICR